MKRSGAQVDGQMHYIGIQLLQILVLQASLSDSQHCNTLSVNVYSKMSEQGESPKKEVPTVIF